MKEIPLQKGGKFIVDDEDYPVLSRFLWRLDEDGKPITQLTRSDGYTPRPISVTKFLILGQSHKLVIFINGNTLDCRKENIEIRKNAEIIHKAKKQRRTSHGEIPTSEFKGVYWSSYKKGQWFGVIHDDKKRITVYRGKPGDKSRESEIMAAKKYNERAVEIYGEFAYQNIIIES